MNEYTLAIIKPDAVRSLHAGRILTEMEMNFAIEDVLLTKWTPAFARKFYEEHAGKSFFNDLVAFMCSGPLYLVMLSGEDAVQRWRMLMGPTDPLKAPMNTLRGRFTAKDGVIMHNAVHGSDTPESAAREISLVEIGLTKVNIAQQVLRPPFLIEPA